MRTAALYGVLIAVVLISVSLIAERAVVFALIGLQLSLMSAVLWVRTRLRLYSAGMLLVGLSGFIVAALHAWSPPATIAAISTWLLIPAAVSFGFLTQFIEKRNHPEEVKALSAAIKDASLLDVVLLRHIPRLRSRTVCEIRNAGQSIGDA